jgi:hypothetical protein
MIPECRVKDLTGNREIPKTLTTKARLSSMGCCEINI